MTVKKRGRWVSIYLPELKGFVLLQTRSVLTEHSQEHFEFLFLLNELSIHNVVHETFGQQIYSQKKTLSPMVATIIFHEVFFGCLLNWGKNTSFFSLEKHPEKTKSFCRSTFVSLATCRRGARVSNKSRSVSCFFLPWKVCRQERSGGSDF